MKKANREARPALEPRRSPVSRTNLSEQVAAKIKAYIIDHALGEGDRLPTEQQMTEMFGVSRISVREATKALSFLGIIRSAPRRGLTVGRVDMGRVTEYLGFHFALNNYPRGQLLAARTVIETGALAESMERIAGDPALYETLLAVSERLREARDVETFIDGDLAFHRALLEASGIEPLVAFNGLLEVFFRRFRDRVIAARPGWGKGIESHRQILDALRARDAEKARALLQAHLAHYRGQ
jgi:DNA-binding FadR family transcriptional regulator